MTLLTALEDFSLGGSGANVDVQSGGTPGNIWGCMVLVPANTLITSMICLVKQAAIGANSLQMAIYDLTGTLVMGSVFGNTTTTGLKTLALTTPTTLVGGTLYFFALLCTANGSRFLGRSAVGEPGTTPIVSWQAVNLSACPASVASSLSNTNVNRVWVAGI